MLVERFESRTTLLTILVLFVTLLLSACTDYYPLYVEEYGYGKSNKGVEFDGSKVKDLRNGRSYDVAKVGDVYWMMDNLAYEFYVEHDDGDGKTNCPRQYIETCEEYGFLYSGERLEYACPKGWRLPSAEEWKEYYNSSAYQSRTYKKDTYMGYYGGDGSLNDDGNAAYFWTNGEADNSGYRKCVTVTPESDSFTQDRTCNKQWKLSVRCVLDEADAKVTSSSSGQNGEGKQSDCSVSDGVKVVEPGEGDVYQVHQTVKLVFGSDMDYGGFGVELRYDGGNKRINLLDQTIDNAIIDGKTCNEYLVDLPMDVTADDAFIYVYPYAKQSKNGKSGTFRIVESLSGEETGNAEDDAEEFSFKDSRNGREYNAMKIGGKNWMLDNLKYGAEENYCIDGCEDGVLYTWDAAMKACPGGWHLPSVEEWKSFFSTKTGKEKAGEMFGGSCQLRDSYVPKANIEVSVRPTANLDEERCTTTTNWKDCGELFIKVVNNDKVDYTDLELRLYVGSKGTELSEIPVSNEAHVVGHSGQTVSAPQIAMVQYLEDDTGRTYLPIFINGTLPASGGELYFQVLWPTLNFHYLQLGWSLVEHTGNEYYADFGGVDLTKAPLYRDEMMSSKEPYTVDDYIPVFAMGELVSGITPDGLTEEKLFSPKCDALNEVSMYWSSDGEASDAFCLANDEFSAISKTYNAALVRCVQD